MEVQGPTIREQYADRKFSGWQRFVDLVIIFTAVGMTFLIVFALMAQGQRTAQLQEQIQQNKKVLGIVRDIAKSSEQNVEEHRESALRQHCSTAVLAARSDGEVNDAEKKLIRIACTH